MLFLANPFCFCVADGKTRLQVTGDLLFVWSMMWIESLGIESLGIESLGIGGIPGTKVG
jgi:hypothetical protein